MPVKDPFIGGLELKFYPSAEFESLDGIDSSAQAPIIARNALRLLMMGWNPSWKELISSTTFKAVFIERDPHLLKELRLAFQNGFEYLFTQLKDKVLTPEQYEQVQLYLSNGLSLLPYSDLTLYETIKIPQYIDNEWTLVEYNVVPIELTNRTGLDRLLLEDYDRVFAYGLEPLSNPKAKSRLIFMGTTYPAGQGFLPQIVTDLKGFETVGNTLYKSGRERLREWISNQQGKIDVCGMSLGGSLSLLLAIDQGDKLARVDAMNPAGLHEPKHKDPFDHWDELQEQPQVIVQKQNRDPVSPFGFWKKGWDILEVVPPTEKEGPNAYCDHFLNYAGFAETKFTYLDPEEDNLTRKTRNFWLYSIGRSIIYYPFLIPYQYVFRPIGNFILSKKDYFAVALTPVIVVTALALLGALTGFILPAILIAGALGLVGLIGVYTYKNEVPELKTPYELDIPKLLDPSLPRNPNMDIYNPDFKVDVQLTHQEAYTYYKTTRCLMKNKDYLPADEGQSKQVNVITKKEMLLKIQNPENAQESVTLKTTRAKAVHIKNTMTLFKQKGTDNDAELKTAMEENYHKYKIGKQYSSMPSISIP